MAQKESQLEFDAETYISAVDRIKKFKSEAYEGWKMESTFLGESMGCIGFRVNLHDDTGEIVSSGHCFRKAYNHEQFQIAETMAYSRAIANAGIMIGASIASKDEVEESSLPQDQPANGKITDLLKSGQVK